MAAVLRRSSAPSFSGLAAEAVGPEAGRFRGVEVFGAKEYENYRLSRYGEITHKALLVDAAGTLLILSQPMAKIYRKIGEKYGLEYSEEEILRRYRWAYEQPWGQSRLRYENDGRPFWQFIVSSSTGCFDPQYFEEPYNYYTTARHGIWYDLPVSTWIGLPHRCRQGVPCPYSACSSVLMAPSRRQPAIWMVQFGWINRELGLDSGGEESLAPGRSS